MLKNFLRMTFRNLWRNKTFSAINIAGLAIGMSACLLILQYVSFEMSFDQFNTKTKDIYRVANDRYQNGQLIQHGTITYSAIGKAMKNDFPEVVDNAKVVPWSEIIFTYNDKKIVEPASLAADSSFLAMFSYPLLAGDSKTALNKPNMIVLTETLARKIFDYRGNDFQTLLGKTLVLNRDSMPYTVTGICRDVPENSHLNFNVLVSFSTMYKFWQQSDYDFTDSDFWHYIQLRPGTDYKAFEKKFPAFSQRHFQGSKVSGSDEKFHLQPLSKAHLYSDYEYEIGNTGSATVVWGLLIIAVFIIVIAWVNYINLTTAKSAERAKEVGIRKVSGAHRNQLIIQFLAESTIINLIAFAIALLIVFFAQSAFNNLVGHNLSLSYLFQKGLSGYAIVIGLVALTIGGILLSGFYPAFVLSSFQPILVLKGKFSTSKKGIVLRKGLVIAQFTITVALIIGSIVVFKQVSYMNKQKLGLNIDQMMVIKAPILTEWDSTFISKSMAFKDELKQIPNVVGASTSSNVPGRELARSFDVHRKGTDANTHFTVRRLGVSHEFIKLYKMNLIAGRDFVPTDYNPDWGKLRNIVVNVTATKLLGFRSPEDALGKTIMMGRQEWDIAGVVDDFHQKSLRFAVEPTILIPTYGTYNPISVKVSTRNLDKTIDAIKKQYASFFPGNMFDYYFLDEAFNQQYNDDRLFGKVFGIFSAFAIFISALGLFGLSLFSTTQRVKEIGVRKVLGASVSNIVIMISRDFIRLVIVAILLAFPIAWLTMNNWLKDFAYRINISWWIFLLAGSTALLIAILTISIQSIKAALSNPIKSLRTE